MPGDNFRQRAHRAATCDHSGASVRIDTAANPLRAPTPHTSGQAAACAYCQPHLPLHSSLGAVYLMNELSPKFRGALGISGKLALVVTPTAGAFFLRSHLAGHETAAPDPDFLAAKPDAPASQPSTPQHSLAAWQQAANFIYYNPFKLIGAISIPLYGLCILPRVDAGVREHAALSALNAHARVRPDDCRFDDRLRDGLCQRHGRRRHLSYRGWCIGPRREVLAPRLRVPRPRADEEPA